MARKLLLSYDASLDWHYNEDTDFRRSLVDFIIKKGGSSLKSYVSSTILFNVPDEHTPESWRTILLNEYTYQFNFTIVAIAQYRDEEQRLKYREVHNENDSIEENFDALVQRVSNLISEERRRNR